MRTRFAVALALVGAHLCNAQQFPRQILRVAGTHENDELCLCITVHDGSDDDDIVEFNIDVDRQFISMRTECGFKISSTHAIHDKASVSCNAAVPWASRNGFLTCSSNEISFVSASGFRKSLHRFKEKQIIRQLFASPSGANFGWITDTDVGYRLHTKSTSPSDAPPMLISRRVGVVRPTFTHANNRDALWYFDAENWLVRASGRKTERTVQHLSLLPDAPRLHSYQNDLTVQIDCVHTVFRNGVLEQLARVPFHNVAYAGGHKFAVVYKIDGDTSRLSLYDALSGEETPIKALKGKPSRVTALSDGYFAVYSSKVVYVVNSAGLVFSQWLRDIPRDF